MTKLWPGETGYASRSTNACCLDSTTRWDGTAQNGQGSASRALIVVRYRLLALTSDCREILGRELTPESGLKPDVGQVLLIV